MKRSLAIILTLCLCFGLFAACTSRGQEDSGDPSDSQSGDRQTSYTEEEAARNNSQLEELEVNLVQFQQVRSGDTLATIRTSMGDITVKLFPEHAPKAVENFVTLAEEGYYNGKVFHRIVPDQLVQTGSLDNEGNGGKTIFTGEDGEMVPFENEYSTDLWHFRGALSMANSGDDNSNTSQFFIVQTEQLEDKYVAEMEAIHYPAKVIERYQENGGSPYLDWKHTVFGQVVDGMEAVDAMNAVEVDEESNHRPYVDIIIETITVQTAD